MSIRRWLETPSTHERSGFLLGLAFFVGAGFSVPSPSRGPQDRLAGTVLVPR